MAVIFLCLNEWNWDNSLRCMKVIIFYFKPVSLSFGVLYTETHVPWICFFKIWFQFQQFHWISLKWSPLHNIYAIFDILSDFFAIYLVIVNRKFWPCPLRMSFFNYKWIQIIHTLSACYIKMQSLSFRRTRNWYKQIYNPRV